MGSLSDIMTKKEDSVEFSFKDFFSKCFAKWPWFVASFVVCVGIAVLYILRQEPEYERSEEILIKDQDSGGGIGDIANAFSSFGLVSTSSSVYNELISLRSPAVMYEVAKGLDLDMDYNKRGGFHPVTLYGKTLPVKVIMQDVEEQGSASFRMALDPDGGIRLWKFKKYVDDDEIKFDDEIEVDKGSRSVKTPIGTVLMVDNPLYSGKKLDKTIEIDVSKSPMQSTVEYYCDKLNSSVVDREADVIGLSIRDVSVQRAVDILNNILTVYNEEWVKDKNKIAVATSAFINERLKIIQQELGDVDTSIADYMAKTGTPDIVESTKASYEKSGALEVEMLTISNTLSISEYMKSYLADGSNAFKVIPANTGIGNVALEQQIAEYNKVLLARNNILDNSSAANPLVQDYDTNLASMRESIIRSVDNQVKGLRLQLSNVRKELRGTEGKISETPTKALPLLTEERQQKVKESLYLFLLQKREENELSQKFTADNTRVITPPMGSLKPVSPKKMIILLVALVFAALIPLVAVYIMFTSDTKVRSKKDLENVKMPFVGEIPQVGKRGSLKTNAGKRHRSLKDEKAPMAVVEEGKRDVVNEAFRVIRSNLDFMSGKKQGSHVVMISSINPGSGKSFVSYNLALSFAIRKKSVLVVDCDLRHGSASMFVGMPKKGITDYLTSRADDWHSLVVQSSANQELAILPIGKMPPNPAELLEGSRLGSLIEEARKEYDYVFLDCPPVNIVVDTQIVAPYADTTLFVVRAGLLERAAISELNEFYAEKKFNHMALILNGTDAAHSRYYTYGNYQSFAE